MKKVLKHALLISILLTSLYACKDEMKEHYERPDWLRGNMYEVLKEKGNYTLFLQAVDTAGYNDIVNGKGLCTVFAPDDEAFRSYLVSNNYSSIQDIPLEELKIIVGVHIVQYAFKTNHLLNFQYLGENNLESTPAGMNYKQKTFAKADIQKQPNPLNGYNSYVYNKEKFLSIISTELFKTRQIDNPEADYKYFFPNSQWYGDQDKLYIANAGVKEYGIPTDNGYLYLIDAVVNPQKTLYQIMEQQPENFSTFLTLYNKFAEFKYDADLSATYLPAGDSLFLFYHNSLPKIASEWTYNDENRGSMYMHKLTGVAFNLFAPDNNAMNRFLTEFFEDNYQSFSDIPLITIFYLLQNHIKDGDIIFPNNIEKGENSIYGDPFGIDIYQDITHKELASNGTFYGINKVITPAMFRSVSAPVFKSDEYTIFAYILHKALELTQLINMENEYTLFIPTNETFQQLMDFRLNMGNGSYGNEQLQRETSHNKWERVSDAEIIEIAQQHIIPEKISNLQVSEIYETKAEFTYIILNQGSVSGEGSPETIPTKVWENLENGVAYEINSILGKSERNIVGALQFSSQLTTFYSKLVEAEIIGTDGVIEILGGEKVIVFAPSNDALSQITLPTDKKELADYLSYFFVSVGVNNLPGYILPSFSMDGNYQTLSINSDLSTPYETVYYTINISDQGNRLKLISEAGNTTIETTAGFPTFASDGIIYTIQNVIQP